MMTDRDDDSVRRYREASQALDERPSAAARAAILAAAARQVDAKPQVADAPRSAHRRRWPLAAAAGVLLSTLAVMLAQRTEQEMPVFTAPVERPPEQVAAASAPPAPAPATESRVAQVPPATPPAIAPARVPRTSNSNEARAGVHAGAGDAGSRLNKATPGAPSDERMSESSAARERTEAAPAIAADATTARAKAAREPEIAGADARSAPAAPPAAPPPPVAGSPATSPSAEALGAASRALDAAKPEASTERRAARRDTAPAVPGVMRQEAARDFEHSAQAWLAYIAKLRGDGRGADADAELKRFRERYPDVHVPATALPPGAPAGTR